MSQKCRKKDGKMVSYYKRTNKKGTSYQAIIRVKGYKPKFGTYKLKSQAQAWAEPIEIAMKNGSYKEKPEIIDDSPRANIESCHDLIEYFRKEIAPDRYSSPEKYKAMYDWWDSEIGEYKVTELSSSIISSKKELLRTEPIYKGKTETTRRNNTINKYLMCISAILTYAVKELELIEINPCSKVSPMTKPDGRKRFLSMDEISIFLKACKEHSLMVYVYTLILISTGARYSEVLHLRVEDIDYENQQIYYLNTKNKESRGVPIEQNVLELIKQYLQENQIDTGNIFRPKRSDGAYPYIKGILEKIIVALELKDFHIHDIRHTTASYIAMSGGSLLDIAEILGHKSLVMARRYSHLTKKHTATVLNKVTSKILPDV